MSAQVATSILRLPPLPTIRDIVKLYRLRAVKQLSQNFLMDQRILDRIVRAAAPITPDHHVFEVGPGPGSITRSIIKHAPKKVVVVEKDPRFLPSLQLLQEACQSHVNLKIVTGDILSYDFVAELTDSNVSPVEWTDRPPPINIIGNLPFNISTILIVKWLKCISEQSSAWQFGRAKMTLTFQKEVAERICAPIMTAERCRLSVMCQMWCDVKHNFTIPGSCFVPKPDVDVGVVTFQPLTRPLTRVRFDRVEKFLRTIFNMRQKYVVKGATNLFPVDVAADLTKQLFDTAQVDAHARSFQITNVEYARLLHVYETLCVKFPEIDAFDFRACKAK